MVDHAAIRKANAQLEQSESVVLALGERNEASGMEVQRLTGQLQLGALMLSTTALSEGTPKLFESPSVAEGTPQLFARATDQAKRFACEYQSHGCGFNAQSVEEVTAHESICTHIPATLPEAVARDATIKPAVATRAVHDVTFTEQAPLGLTIAAVDDHSLLRVQAVQPTSLAALAGLEVGLQLLGVNGQPVLGTPYDVVSASIKQRPVRLSFGPPVRLSRHAHEATEPVLEEDAASQGKDELGKDEPGVFPAAEDSNAGLVATVKSLQQQLAESQQLLSESRQRQEACGE